MKVGSIVFFIGMKGKVREDVSVFLPGKNKPYTVKNIVEHYGETLIMLEEFCFGYNPNGKEMGCRIEYFREIEFPPLLEAEIQECLTREFELI
jgi:hypothetical protein